MPQFCQHTLTNGLRIAAEIDSRGYSAAFGYFVGAGARNETDAESGLSHFLEHMMFKGTATRSAADVNREFDELGGQSNAYTSEEQTVYHATVLPKFQHRVIDVLSDMLSPKLDESEFDTERQVILEEIAKYEDQPPFGAFERAMEIYFTPRGIGRRVLGTAESIETMQVETMRAYFNRRYRPENIVLAASGNVDFDALVAQVETLTADWADRPVGMPPPADDSATLPVGIAVDHELAISDAAQTYMVTMGPGPSKKCADRYATHLLSVILGDEGGSRLFWELIDTGLADVATIWPQEFSDTGATFSYLSCAPEDVDENRALMSKVVADLVSGGVTDDELQQAINKATAGCIMQSERPSNRLFGIGSRWLTMQEYVSTDDVLERYKSVTLDQVNQAAVKYLSQPTIRVVARGDQD